MLRINLLPREVLERHRFEGWYRYIFIVSFGLIILVLLVAAGLYLAVQQASDELQTAKDQAQRYAEQGRAFDIFEKKENELAERQTVSQNALSGRLNLGKIAEEISLVLPDEVWLDTMSLGQDTGMSFAGNTPRSSSESMNISYKSIARTLVRVNELPLISDVWLASSTNGVWNAWDASSNSTTDTPVVQFTTTAKIGPSAATTSTATTGTGGSVD